MPAGVLTEVAKAIVLDEPGRVIVGVDCKVATVVDELGLDVMTGVANGVAPASGKVLGWVVGNGKAGVGAAIAPSVGWTIGGVVDGITPGAATGCAFETIADAGPPPDDGFG
jgi:hypothetical protein